MSVASGTSSVRTDATANLTPEDHAEFATLPTLLKQWRDIQEEKRKLAEQKKVILQGIKEMDKRGEVMEGMIMGIMKKHGIGAVDLKSSNARVLYKKSSRKAPIPKKAMENYLAEHLKSEEAAKSALAFLDTKRETKIKEALIYEKNQVA
jgi:hypothetical protein